MATSVAYTNPDFVSELTGVTVTPLHCQLASSIIDNHAGRSFNGTSYTDKIYSGDGSAWLDLGAYPISGVTSVKVDDDLLDISEYKTPAQHGQAEGYLYNENGWEVGQGNIKVSFTVGSNVDDAIVYIASMIASILKKDTEVENVRSETIGQYTVTYVSDDGAKTQIQRVLEYLPQEGGISAIGGVTKPQNSTIDNPRYYNTEIN